MKLLENKLRTTGKYTNYQIQQIIYLVKTFSSDISKSVLLAILFRNHLDLFALVMVMLFLLRSYSGGMHFHTYMGCLIATTCYFSLAILILPQISVPFAYKVLFLIVCMILCDRVGPVTSEYRPPLSPERITHFRNITITLLFLFILILYVIPEHPYSNVGFWVIILHSLQLVAAKLLAQKKISSKEGGNENV